MKLKHLFAAAIVTVAAATLTLPLIRAAAPDTTAPATNSPDAVSALFGDPIIAKGTGVAIKRSELDQVLTGIKSAAAARGEEISPDQMAQIEAQMLERLIDIQLLTQQANDADKATGEKKAEEAMVTLHEKAGSQDTLNMQLKAAGTTEAELRAKVMQEATAMQALQRLLGVTVTDAEIQKFYNDHPSDFEQPELVHVRHILLMTMDPTTREPLADDVVAAKRKEADDILMKAQSGEDFAKLAQEYSEDPTTKDKGGELPPFGRGQMLPEFEAAAFALTNNQVSPVVKTVYGYHIIKFIDKTPARKLALTDTVPTTTEIISDRIKELLVQQKTDQLAQPYLDKLQKSAGVQVTDPELNAAVTALAAAQANTNAPAETVPPTGEK